jgi:hypothetical protein
VEQFNAKFQGDFVDIDGTLNVDGATTLVGAVEAGSTLKVTGAVTLAACTFQTNGAAWATSGATPTFVSGQTYMTLTCGTTVFRIPLFANA